MNCCSGTKVRYLSKTVAVNGKLVDIYDTYHAHEGNCLSLKTWDVEETLPTDSNYAKYLKNRFE